MKDRLQLLLIDWAVTWVSLFCELMGVLTFTLYRPFFDFKIMHFFSKKKTEIIMRIQNE